MEKSEGRIFAVGDIHGCYDKLRELMEIIDIDFNADSLVFMGDYIDRGSHSYEVIRYLMGLKEHHSNVCFLKGNHELMLENYLSDIDRTTFLVNGGRHTLKSYRDHGGEGSYPIPADHLDFLGSLSLYHETDRYIFVHAGLSAEIPLNMQGSEELLWVREKFVLSDHDFGKRVIFGHTPFSEPLVTRNKIGIDTGAVYGNRLTCVRLPDLFFYSV